MVPTPKQGPVRTDLTPRNRNECLAVAQALNEQAKKLSQPTKQGVPREFARVASNLDRLRNLVSRTPWAALWIT